MNYCNILGDQEIAKKKTNNKKAIYVAFTNAILKVFFLSSESVCSSCFLSSALDEGVFSSFCGSDVCSLAFSELSDFSGTAALRLTAGGSGCEEEAQQFTTNQQNVLITYTVYPSKPQAKLTQE